MEEKEIKYWNSCKLPLAMFIQVLTENNLHYLVISGEPTDEELKEAWTTINTEYTDLVGDAETKGYVENQSRILYLSSRIDRVKMVVAILKIYHWQPLIDQMKADDFDFDFDYDDLDSYLQDLDRVLIDLKMHEIELDQLQQLEKKNEDEPEEKAKKAITEEYFVEILLEISHRENRSIKIEDISTMEYALLIKRLKKHYATPKPPKSLF